RGQQALSLVLRYVRAVDDIPDELQPEWQCQIAAIDVTRLFLINDEEVFSLALDPNIDVLAQLYIPLRAKHEEPPISPRPKPVRSKPVQAHVAHSPVTTQHH